MNSAKLSGALPPPQQRRSASGAILDARAAIFLPEFSVLAVADLHLGYAWAQRSRGLLLPVDVPDSTPGRLAQLVRDYSPRTVVLLGDLVHRASALPGMEASLRALCRAMGGAEIVLCPGNHDRRIDSLITEWSLPVRITPELRLGRYRLCHGDDPLPGNSDFPFSLSGETAITVIGHEHPAIDLGDGGATRARVPCFLESDSVLVLPAFSEWAAGCVVGRDAFLGSLARSARFHTAYAILGPRLLPIPINIRAR